MNVCFTENAAGGGTMYNIKNKTNFQKIESQDTWEQILLLRERNLLENSNMETFETLFKLLAVFALKLTLKIFSTN